ncbi:hypothetical protein ColLi_04909 [Colletotrichum liriopes]|uniref:Uncharacterized protein n=1 Tax=Colletotrichum liriopes TaxID=708192 RepID=A0AA37GKN1_9PEZI|nr:hypothetical protein ColLi_04909 [Colletotrichum liriopes]
MGDGPFAPLQVVEPGQTMVLFVSTFSLGAPRLSLLAKLGLDAVKNMHATLRGVPNASTQWPRLKGPDPFPLGRSLESRDLPERPEDGEILDL